MQEYIMYLLCSVVHCASVLSCSCLSMRRMGGDMHLLIDGQKSGVVLDCIDSRSLHPYLLSINRYFVITYVLMHICLSVRIHRFSV